MDEEFSDTFLGFARPAELAPEELERPSAPSTGGRGGRSHARPRPANAAAAAGRREGLGDAMLDGINRNDERRDSVRRERELDSLIENVSGLRSDFQQYLAKSKKCGGTVSNRKADLFPGVNVEGFAALLASIRHAGPVRVGGGNAALHFRRLLVKYCHIKGTWSYHPAMKKRLAVLYFKVLQTLHADDLEKLKVDTLSTAQVNVFIAKFLSSVVDHNITQWKSHIKGKIKDNFCMSFAVPRTRFTAPDEQDPAYFDLLGRNTKINHQRIAYTCSELLGKECGCLQLDDVGCDQFVSFLFSVWNDVRNWSGYGAFAPSFHDVAWIVHVADQAFTELASEDQVIRCVFFLNQVFFRSHIDF